MRSMSIPWRQFLTALLAFVFLALASIRTANATGGCATGSPPLPTKRSRDASVFRLLAGVIIPGDVGACASC